MVKWLIMAGSMLAGGGASIAMSHSLIQGGDSHMVLPVVLGTLFAGLGWMFTETMVETIVLLLITGAMGAVALTSLDSVVLRVVVVSILAGFNIGKITGAVYQVFKG